MKNGTFRVNVQFILTFKKKIIPVFAFVKLVENSYSPFSYALFDKKKRVFLRVCLYRYLSSLFFTLIEVKSFPTEEGRQKQPFTSNLINRFINDFLVDLHCKVF